MCVPSVNRQVMDDCIEKGQEHDDNKYVVNSSNVFDAEQVS